MSGDATHFVWLPAIWPVRMVLQLLECLVLLLAGAMLEFIYAMVMP